MSDSTGVAAAKDPEPPRGVTVPDRGDLVGGSLAQRYHVLRPLWDGLTAGVYVARQVALERMVALAVMKLRDGHDPDVVRRFEHGARAASHLNHPNTVTIHDFGLADGGYVFVAMELLPGRPLRAYLGEHAPLPPQQAVDIALQVCASLADAHEHGTVHRSLDDSAVRVVPAPGGQTLVKVGNFEHARLSEGEGGPLPPAFKEAHAPFGAPEAGRASADHRVDVYSLGVLLYLMLTGTMPFSAPTARALVLRHRHQQVPAFASRVPHIPIPSALEDVVRRCLAKDPRERFQFMGEVGQALNEAMPDVRRRPWLRCVGMGRPLMGRAAYVRQHPEVPARDTLVAPLSLDPLTLPAEAMSTPPPGPPPPVDHDEGPTEVGRFPLVDPRQRRASPAQSFLPPPGPTSHKGAEAETWRDAATRPHRPYAIAREAPPSEDPATADGLLADPSGETWRTATTRPARPMARAPFPFPQGVLDTRGVLAEPEAVPAAAAAPRAQHDADYAYATLEELVEAAKSDDEARTSADAQPTLEDPSPFAGLPPPPPSAIEPPAPAGAAPDTPSEEIPDRYFVSINSESPDARAPAVESEGQSYGLPRRVLFVALLLGGLLAGLLLGLLWAGQ